MWIRYAFPMTVPRANCSPRIQRPEGPHPCFPRDVYRREREPWRRRDQKALRRPFAATWILGLQERPAARFLDRLHSPEPKVDRLPSARNRGRYRRLSFGTAFFPTAGNGTNVFRKPRDRDLSLPVLAEFRPSPE